MRLSRRWVLRLPQRHAHEDQGDSDAPHNYTGSSEIEVSVRVRMLMNLEAAHYHGAHGTLSVKTPAFGETYCATPCLTSS